jgi:hypothetical protein
MTETKLEVVSKVDEKSIITADSHGVEVIYDQTRSQSSSKDKNDTPPRDKNEEMTKKVNLISPPEGQGITHSRSPSYNPADFHGELNVPDSPYSPFYSSHLGHGGYHSHWPVPGSPIKAKSPKRSNEDRQEQYLQSPHYGYHHFAPPAGYDDNHRKMPSPGKRQRLGTTDDQHFNRDREVPDHYSEADRFYASPYQHRTFFSQPGEKRDFYSESFDSGDRLGGPKYAGAPAVSKSSSYPPPPSPSRYDENAADSSASYPGARRPHHPGEFYGHAPYPPRAHIPPAGYPYDYHDHGYYQDSRSHGRYSGPPGQPNMYYADGQRPREDVVHPLLREYDPHRRANHSTDESMSHSTKQLSPDRASKADVESVATTPSLKSKASKASSPNKRKPSTAAKAAIAAGMTQPPSASEVDFDIHNPPLEPVTQPSSEPVCAVTSNVNSNDVLCGRGGGTNTQIGNRRFRALVQEFQPTYLLCRRKEKPLIARTIVLIIRNRGGRFLKKDEGNGMLFEVGDVKAEAKTSQALREGLDVRASKSTTLMGRKKQRERKKKEQEASSSKVEAQTDDMTMTDSPSRSQRDGPPPQHEYAPQYAPPQYYYGYGGQYPPYHYGYEATPAYVSPSRKRQRGPEAEPMYYPPPHYGYKGFHGYPYAPEYHYENYTAAPPPAQVREENPMWEMDFNPPRGSIKKDEQ